MRKNIMKTAGYLVIVNLILLAFFIRLGKSSVSAQIKSPDVNAFVSFYYGTDGNFDEEHRTQGFSVYDNDYSVQSLRDVSFFNLPDLRMDFSEIQAQYYVKSVELSINPVVKYTVQEEALKNAKNFQMNDINYCEYIGGTLSIRTGENDPYIVFPKSALKAEINYLGIVFVLLFELFAAFIINRTIIVSEKDDVRLIVPKEQFCSLDLAKFIGAFLVVAIHQSPLSDFGEMASIIINQGIARIGVPLYFVISGYLFFRKIYNPVTGEFQKNNALLYKYCAHILLMYFVWTFFYYVCDFKNYEVRTTFSFVWNILFVGGYFQLWYLLALVFAVFIIYQLLCSGTKMESLLVMAAVLYIIGLALDFGYAKLFIKSNSFALIRTWFIELFPRGGANGLMFGVPMVAIGALFSTGKVRKIPFSYVISAIIILIIMPLEAILTFRCTTDGATNMWISIPFAVFFVMAALLQHKDLAVSPKIAKMMRSLSTIIYLIHPMFIYIFERIPLFSNSSLIMYFAVCIGCLATGFIMILLQRALPLLKKIY